MGPSGLTGRRGPAGKVELITCKTVNRTEIKKINGKRRKVRVKRQKCTSRLVSGKVKFTIGQRRHPRHDFPQAHRLRHRSPPVKRKTKLATVVTELRPLRPGRYTLTLQSRHGRRSMIRRTQITIT